MKKRGYQNRFILFYKRIGFRNFSFFPFGFYFPWNFGLGFTPSNLFFLTFLFRFGFAPFHLPPSVLFSFLVFFFSPRKTAERLRLVVGITATGFPHMYLYELETQNLLLKSFIYSAKLLVERGKRTLNEANEKRKIKRVFPATEWSSSEVKSQGAAVNFLVYEGVLYFSPPGGFF